jgi:hypothetical protein
MRLGLLVPSCLMLALPLAAAAGLDEWLKQLPGRGAAAPDTATVAAGLKQALEQGTGRAVQALGRSDGFFADARVRIPVPERLRAVEKGMRRLGQERYADEFILSLNRAAQGSASAA